MVSLLVATAASAVGQDVRRTTAPLTPGTERDIYAVATPGPLAAVVPGVLTMRGRTPRPGLLFVTERWIVFRPEGSSEVTTVPVVFTHDDGRPPVWAMRPAESAGGRAIFAIPGWGRFETTRPGALRRLLESRSAADALADARGSLLRNGDSPASIVKALEASGFADTLFAIAGRPRAPLGLLSATHRAAGDAALYDPATDSIALDPDAARSLEDLRGMLAHELGHRLQRARPGLLEEVWSSVAPIMEPEVYGFGRRVEHQAEAFRFAVIYLQTTAAVGRDAESDVELLALYESLMPGTGAVVGALLRQEIYHQHPLRRTRSRPH